MSSLLDTFKQGDVVGRYIDDAKEELEQGLIIGRHTNTLDSYVCYLVQWLEPALDQDGNEYILTTSVRENDLVKL